ncbi:DUF429 domain-containing protein [Yonghaparkia sp. Root332]|uniref:DUF429 domain-containing protein n=1 Tax=Yonghaparkia sp. Root332 TaxID=1736516 RepID=UPI0006FD1497|nr:DUF429 domain-containing protein [Yonghaparkia sp. Root332]KQV24804.1 hypothetical protein ASC54_09910 [Yonghaparkia sp. Root332]
MARYFGIDLAWGLGRTDPRTGRVRPPNETGLCLLDATGRILDAGWARGVDAVHDFIAAHEQPGDVIAIDAPLIVPNPTGMRAAEREVASRYGRWKVAANASNAGSAARAGELLLAALEPRGIRYTDGTGPPLAGTTVAFECYPYTTLVGVAELGYDDERPRYKRLIPGIDRADARARRAAACDDLIARLSRLGPSTPPLDLRSHPATRALVDEPSPITDAAYKHREELLDSVICAWTAALWHANGPERTQVLGADTGEVDARGRRATIVAPARPEQRRAAEDESG